MATEFETLILRFRDLATMPGGTIESHLAKIDSHGHVWWGWWNKAGEKVPVDAFTELNIKAAPDGLKLYLVDSGRHLVYEATCIEFRWAGNRSRFTSPEIECTPEYYRSQAYMAWFNFTSISAGPIDSLLLKNWTYLRVDEFFEQGPSRYVPFYGKQVYSVEELRQQDRTIWFVRPFQEGDPSQEISLLDAHSTTPAHFPDEYPVSPFRHLLWLSDLHFSIDGRHGYPQKSDVAQRALWHSVEHALNANDASEVAGALISGDFTWRADEAEFDQARDFISDLSSKLKLRNYDFLVCPGNHDLAFANEPWNEGQKVTATTEEASAQYKKFYERLFYISPNEYLASGRRMVVHRSVSVEIAALNTNLLQQKEDLFQGHGFVGQQQLDFVAEQMHWNEPQDQGRPLRILMLHHHLLPVMFREIPTAGANYSVALDAEAIVRWVIDHKVRIVLHGHRHQPFYTKVSRKSRPTDDGEDHDFWVLGLGSSGVGKDDVGEIGKNTIGILTFSTETVEYRVLTIDPVNEPEHLWTVTIPI